MAENDQTSSDQSTSRIDELEKKLSKAAPPDEVVKQIKQAARNELMVELMKDPEVTKVLQAKQQGKKVSVVPEDELARMTSTSTPSARELETDWSQFDNSDPKALVEAVRKEVLSAVKSTISEAVNPLSQRLDQVTGVIQNEQVSRAQKLVEDTRKEFPDFDEFVPRMVQLAEENKGLSPKQLYILAKTEAGKPITTDRRTDTERPSSEATRPVKKLEKVSSGRTGIQELVRNATKNIDLSDLMNAIPGQFPD